MFSSTDLRDLTKEIIASAGMDALFDPGPAACYGEENLFEVFDRAEGCSAEELISIITESLLATDEDVEPIIDEFTIWLSHQPWFSDDDFKKLIMDDVVGNYISGYRIVDGEVLNSEQMGE